MPASSSAGACPLYRLVFFIIKLAHESQVGKCLTLFYVQALILNFKRKKEHVCYDEWRFSYFILNSSEESQDHRKCESTMFYVPDPMSCSLPNCNRKQRGGGHVFILIFFNTVSNLSNLTFNKNSNITSYKLCLFNDENKSLRLMGLSTLSRCSGLGNNIMVVKTNHKSKLREKKWLDMRAIQFGTKKIDCEIRVIITIMVISLMVQACEWIECETQRQQYSVDV